MTGSATRLRYVDPAAPMPTSEPPTFDDLQAALDAACAKLASREGDELRARIQRLFEIVDATDDQARDLPARTADELAQLIGALERFVGHAPGERVAGVERIEQLFAALHASAEPVAESPIDRQIAALVRAALEPRGLAALEVQRIVARAKRELATPARQLALGMQREAARSQAMGKLERLLETVAATGSALGKVLVDERAAIVAAFERADLDRMAEGFRVIATWLSTPTSDVAAHLAALRPRLAEALGPLSMAAPTCHEAERTAALERALQDLVARFVSSH